MISRIRDCKSLRSTPVDVHQLEPVRERHNRLLAYVAGIECLNCDHPARHHDNGPCTADAGSCGCDWGPGDIATDIRRILQGDQT